MNIILPLLPSARQLLCLIFVVFKLFGFIPFPLDSYTLQVKPISRCSNWCLGIPALHLMFFLALHAYVAINRTIIFNTEVQIFNLNDLLKCASQLMAVYAILVNIVIQRDIHRSVWVKLNIIRGMASKKFVRLFLRLYLCKFYGFVVFCAAIDCHVVLYMYQYTDDIAYFLVVLVLHVVLRLRHLFHMFFIDVLKVHLQQLHHGLQDITCYMAELHSIPKTSPRYKTMYARSIDRLLHLKSVYGQLWDINDGINRTFGWSQICNFTANFIDISCDLYWFYLFTMDSGFEGVTAYFVTMIPSPCLIVLLLNSAESCLREGSSIGTALLNIPLADDPTLRKIVYRFGLQLAQQRIHLTAHGLFDINYSLLQMIATGITTYMVIFITFSKGILYEDVEDAIAGN
ncbi:putative gustatory receptor 39b [Anopheles ziemanni]|uniref:putative gustatory receptor 39b n=1 Tax=Anopheles coustani TaxID=139045 RepID=UPI00265972D3|nr:putative gustatory receptor 39b [Anopheles coustani]XP_058177442.1 putative gustatory receptor 39b [Anopheles ziemanni]